MKKFDYVIIVAIVLIAVSIFLVLNGKNKNLSKTPIEAEKTIQFNVSVKGATITSKDEIFKAGEKSFLTIRNVPYQELNIVSVKKSPKKTIVAAQNPSGYKVVDDASAPNQYDYVITLEDNAKITSDGAVVGGNKIKIGIPVVLESFNYKLGGTVSNVNIPEDKE